MVDDEPIRFLIDTGSSVNLIDETTYKNLKKKHQLRKSQADIRAYNKETLRTHSVFEAKIKSKDKSLTAEFVRKSS